MHGKRLIGTTLFVLALAGTAAAGPHGTPDHDKGRPAFVQWNPPMLRAQVTFAQTTSYSATFRCSRDLQNVVLMLSPSLAPYLHLDVASFASITAGTAYTVNFTLTTPPAPTTELDQEARYGFAGVLQMRAGGRMVPGNLRMQFHIPEPATGSPGSPE